MKYAIVYKYTPTDMFSGRECDPEYRTYITKDSSDKTRVMDIIHDSNEYELVSKAPIPETDMHCDVNKLLHIVNGIINELLHKENCIFSLVKQMSEFDNNTVFLVRDKKGILYVVRYVPEGEYLESELELQAVAAAMEHITTVNKYSKNIG